MKKTIIITLAVVVIIIMGAIFIWPDDIFPPANNNNTNSQSERTYPEPRDYPFYSLENLINDNREGTLKSGKYNTTGYLIDTWTCPPCPIGAACVPCPYQNAIVISEENIIVAKEITEKIQIEVDSLDQFNIGRSYEFSFSIDEDMQNITLLGYNEQ